MIELLKQMILKLNIDIIVSKLLQYITSIAGGLLIAFESSLPFFVPCFIVTIIDIWTAFDLGKRLHKKYPDKFDGKFKSEYKRRIMKTMIISLLAIILAVYVDTLALGGGNKAVCGVFGFFMFYQVWSICENWSSENDNKIARAFQRIMVNKAERHLNVTLGDILLDDTKEINSQQNNP